MLDHEIPESGEDLPYTGAAYIVVAVTPSAPVDEAQILKADLVRVLQPHEDMARIFRLAFKSLFEKSYHKTYAHDVQISGIDARVTDVVMLLASAEYFGPNPINQERGAPSVFLALRVEPAIATPDRAFEMALNAHFRIPHHTATRTMLSDKGLGALLPDAAIGALIADNDKEKAAFAILPERGAWRGLDYAMMAAFYVYCSFVIYAIEEGLLPVARQVVGTPLSPRNAAIVASLRRRLLLIEKLFFSLSQSSYFLRREMCNAVAMHLRLRARYEWNRRLIGDMERNIEIETQKRQLDSTDQTSAVLSILTILSVPIAIFFGLFDVSPDTDIVANSSTVMSIKAVVTFIFLVAVVVLLTSAVQALRRIAITLKNRADQG